MISMGYVLFIGPQQLVAVDTEQRFYRELVQCEQQR